MTRISDTSSEVRHTVMSLKHRNRKSHIKEINITLDEQDHQEGRLFSMPLRKYYIQRDGEVAPQENKLITPGSRSTSSSASSRSHEASDLVIDDCDDVMDDVES